MLYSFSLVFVLCAPCVIILLITGLLSGNMELELLVEISLTPFMFILPLTLLLTFIHNYRLPKTLRKYILRGLNTLAYLIFLSTFVCDKDFTVRL